MQRPTLRNNIWHAGGRSGCNDQACLFMFRRHSIAILLKSGPVSTMATSTMTMFPQCWFTWCYATLYIYIYIYMHTLCTYCSHHMLYHVISYHVILHYIILYYTISYYIVLYYIVLYYIIILHYLIISYIILC